MAERPMFHYTIVYKIINTFTILYQPQISLYYLYSLFYFVNHVYIYVTLKMENV